MKEERRKPDTQHPQLISIAVFSAIYILDYIETLCTLRCRLTRSRLLVNSKAGSHRVNNNVAETNLSAHCKYITMR